MSHPNGRPRHPWAVQPAVAPGWTHGHPITLSFDFVVGERPEYIPNSGPPLESIEIQPSHDKEGIIEDVRNIDGHACYIVSYEHRPAIRMSVRVENARDYVSARTLEDWEYNQTKIRNALEKEMNDPKVKARKEREEKLLEMKEAATRVKVASKKKNPYRSFGKRKRGRGGAFGMMRKSSNSTMAPGAGMGTRIPFEQDSEGKEVIVEAREASYFISPRRVMQLTPSKQRGLAKPITSEIESGVENENGDLAGMDYESYSTKASNRQSLTPSKQRGLADPNPLDSESEEEDESEDEAEMEPEEQAASNRQSNASDALLHSKESMQDSPQAVFKTPFSTNSTSLASKRSRDSSSASVVSNDSAEGHDDKRHKKADLDDSVASISSRAAFEAFEMLENGKMSWTPRSLADRNGKPSSVKDYPPILPGALRSRSVSRTTKAQANKVNPDAKNGVQNGQPNIPITYSRSRRSSTFPSLAIPARITPLPVPKRTNVQSNKVKADASSARKPRNSYTPAIPSRLRQSNSPRTERSASHDRETSRRRSDRGSSRVSSIQVQDTLNRRRSDRSSPRASVNYTIPPPLEPEDLEPEIDNVFDVEAIVGEKWKTIKGEQVAFYLIKWLGYEEKTWEHADHVGPGSIAEWELEKLKMQKKKTPVKITPKKVQKEEDDDEDELSAAATPAPSVKVHPFFSSFPKSSRKTPDGFLRSF